MPRRTHWVTFCLTVVGACLLAGESRAVDPLENFPAPHGLYYLNYPLHYRAERWKDGHGDTLVDDAEIRSTLDVSRLNYYNKEALGQTFAVTAWIPYGSRKAMDDRDEGLGDLTLAAALTVVERTESHTYLSVVGYLDVPTGHYSPKKAANMGTNTWRYGPSLAFAQKAGIFDLEATLKVNFYSENHDTQVRRGSEVVGEVFAGMFLSPNLLVGGHFDSAWGSKAEWRGDEVPDSATRRYDAGASLTYFRGSEFGATLKALGEFGVRNGPAGQLYQGRVYWKF